MEAKNLAVSLLKTTDTNEVIIVVNGEYYVVKNVVETNNKTFINVESKYAFTDS